MEQIVKILMSPEFWFSAVLVQLLVGLLTNRISKSRPGMWLNFALFATAALLFGLHVFGYSDITARNRVLAWGYGIFTALVFVAPTFFPSVWLRAYTLLSLHGTAALIAWLIATSPNAPGGYNILLYVYPTLAGVFGIVTVLWILFAYNPTPETTKEVCVHPFTGRKLYSPSVETAASILPPIKPRSGKRKPRRSAE